MKLHPARVALALLLTVATQAAADDLHLLPSSARLVGPNASQRFLPELRRGEAWVGESQTSAKFVSDNPAVAEVSADGTVIPRSDGTATIRAEVDGKTATAVVSVEGSGIDRPFGFRNDVLPVLSKVGCNSGACHGAAAGKSGLRLTLRGYGAEVDYDVLTRQSIGRRVNKTAPGESLMLLKPTGAIEHGGGALFGVNSPEYRILSGWIAAGTPPPAIGDARPIALMTYPDAAILKRGQAQRILVQARFSDGRVEDVTRWARFSGADDSVAKVDESGRVTVEGSGEAPVNVWYSSLVGRSTITVPAAEPPPAQVFDDAPRRNFIDDANLAKLRALGIPPSPDSDDATFLRRAYLDATGTLPRADAVAAFLDDADPAKRSKLVDRLLESPEYVDYWSYKWSDLLLISSKNLPAQAMWSFYRFVRKAVADNTPWDEFARRVITARGSTLADGAGNYFVLHRDPIDLTENASMAFLGLSLTCARCHNHPMEKWTQDQYYGMANLFSRVRLKDGKGAGDVVVTAASEGDIRHPRTGGVMAPQPLDDTALDVNGRDDRREAFADWLAKPENPYFARAIVNRIWRNFFGRGLVDPEDDLRATNPASDELLMKQLVDDFLAHKYDTKHLARTIMNSAAYARSSVPLPGNAGDVKFLSHFTPRRLPAEVLLDAVADVAGVPTPFAGYPAGYRSLQLPDSRVESTFLGAFGRPERVSTCSCERSAEPSIAQALHLSNGSTINDKLRSEDGAVALAFRDKLDDTRIIDRLYLSALSRRPTDAERTGLIAVLAESVAGITDPAMAAASRRQAVEDVYWAILTGKEFLFNH
ncbi:DUF1553 domain-containing protein [Isosphaeraceae bacterium EP7]